MRSDMREAHRMRLEKIATLKKEVESVVIKFESDNDGWNVSTLVYGNGFDMNFAIDVSKVNL